MTEHILKHRAIQHVQDSLEELVDGLGLCDTLHLLAQVCSEKADHLRSNWQDENAAKVWDSAGATLKNVTQRLDIRGVSYGHVDRTKAKRGRAR